MRKPRVQEFVLVEISVIQKGRRQTDFRMKRNITGAEMNWRTLVRDVDLTPLAPTIATRQPMEPGYPASSF